jgi:hypothetical protein
MKLDRCCKGGALRDSPSSCRIRTRGAETAHDGWCVDIGLRLYRRLTPAQQLGEVRL